MFGNHAKWKVHATGLREMVRTKGGMSSIDPGLQMKICRYAHPWELRHLPLMSPTERTSKAPWTVSQHRSYLQSQELILLSTRRYSLQKWFFKATIFRTRY